MRLRRDDKILDEEQNGKLHKLKHILSMKTSQMLLTCLLFMFVLTTSVIFTFKQMFLCKDFVPEVQSLPTTAHEKVL